MTYILKNIRMKSCRIGWEIVLCILIDCIKSVIIECRVFVICILYLIKDDISVKIFILYLIYNYKWYK